MRVMWYFTKDTVVCMNSLVGQMTRYSLHFRTYTRYNITINSGRSGSETLLLLYQICFGISYWKPIVIFEVKLWPDMKYSIGKFCGKLGSSPDFNYNYKKLSFLQESHFIFLISSTVVNDKTVSVVVVLMILCGWCTKY